jgi:hypothetical protein
VLDDGGFAARVRERARTAVEYYGVPQATRRLADNPKAAFRAVRGLVLAVFLGTIAGTLIPAVESLSTTPNAAALSNVLLDAFAGPNLGPSQAIQGNQGLAPRAGATLVSDLRAIGGDAVYPLYSSPQAINPGYQGNDNAIVGCQVLRDLAAFGRCAATGAAHGSSPRWCAAGCQGVRSKSDRGSIR